MKTGESRLQIIGALLAAILLSIRLASASQEDVALDVNLDKGALPSGSGTLVIEADRGDIDILPSDDDRVTIKVTRKARASSEQKEKDMLANHKVEFTRDGSTLRVTGKMPKESSNWFNRGQLDVHYNVSIPVSYSASLKTAGGNIKIKELTGTVDAWTAGGNIGLGKVGKANVHTSGGNISVDHSSASAELDTSGGDITVGEIGADLSAHTSGGNVKIEKILGKANLRTSGGDIGVKEIDGNLQASTSGGNIRVHLANSPGEDTVLRTSGGNIQVKIDAKVAFDLDAETSGGSVRATVPISITAKSKESNFIRGQVNGGGKNLKLRTSGGDIHVENADS